MDSSRKRRRFDDEDNGLRYDDRGSRRRSRSPSVSPNRKDYDRRRSRDRYDDRYRSSRNDRPPSSWNSDGRRPDEGRGSNGNLDRTNLEGAPASDGAAAKGPSDEAELKKQRLQKIEMWRKQQAAKAQASGASPTAGDASPLIRESSPGPTTSWTDRSVVQTAAVIAENGRQSPALPTKPGFGGGTLRSGGPGKPAAPGLPTLTRRSKLGFDDEDDDQDDVSASRRSRKLRSLEEMMAGSGPATDSGTSPAPVTKETVAEKAEDRMDVDVPPEHEEDPLDAFMQDVSAEVTKLVHDTKAAVKYEPNGMLEEEEGAVGEAVLKVDEDDEDAGDEEEDILALAAKAKAAKKKDLVVVDHAAQKYEPFRKDFWVEPPDLADLTTEEVDLARAELDGIKIRGVDCPKPARKWTQLGLPPGGLEVIRKVLKYDKPTPIQSQAISAIMSGRDVIGVAKTGSGKTIAFLLPMFRHIKDQAPLGSGDGPIALIMTPTRELALQIHKDCRHFARVMGLRAVCAYGGSPIKDQIADMKRGAEIVVCTPGRMIDLLCANSGRVTNLRRVTYLVLDEADRMFDMGFEPQVMKIVNNIRPDRQTVLFSATFPRQMEGLARKILHKPLEITVGGRSTVAPEVTQIVEVLPEEAKFLRLLKILGNWENDGGEEQRALIFVEKQEKSDRLLGDLMHHGYSPLSIHGGKDQMDRDSTIADFKQGVTKILIATSVAARGLDVKNLNVVVNYDTPNHMEDYVHRVGRTGRAGNKGTAYTFISPEQDKYAVDIVKALKMSNTHVPEDLQELADSFIAKVKAGNAKFHSSGYGGKGLDKLDQQRDMQKSVEKKLHGADADEEEAEESEAAEAKKEASEAEAIKAGATTTGPTATAAGGTASASGVADAGAAVTGAQTAAADQPKSAALEALRAAQEKAAALNAALGIGKTTAAGGQKDILKSINIRYKGDGESPASNLPNASAYSVEIEINDYPQKARWKVTNKETMVQLIEATGAAITTRGTFFPKGKEPDLARGERKLFLLVEGESELVVDHARTEIMRILKDATLAAAEAEATQSTGRYSVV